jgi:Sulfotransferase domain
LNVEMVAARLKKVANTMLGRLTAGRDVTVFDDDVFITSYPRSGNTWFRFLVANLKTGGMAGFSNLESLVPDVYQNSDAVLRRAPRPRILKSHEAFDGRYPRVIYLIRDPRDVAVSYYHFLIKWRLIDDGYSIERYVSRFVAGDVPFGSWGDHAESWMSLRPAGMPFVLIRYEDLLADPVRELVRGAELLGVDRGAAALFERAVALSSADRMRELEKREFRQWATTRHSRDDKEFVRGARHGTWLKELPADEAERIAERWQPLMRGFGYLD